MSRIDNARYETVAAEATDQALGPTGAKGDYLGGLLISPAAADCGVVTIADGGGTAIPIFAGGSVVPLPTLAPFFVPICAQSQVGAWSVTTGVDVTVVATGNFS